MQKLTEQSSVKDEISSNLNLISSPLGTQGAKACRCSYLKLTKNFL